MPDRTARSPGGRRRGLLVLALVLFVGGLFALGFAIGLSLQDSAPGMTPSPATGVPGASASGLESSSASDAAASGGPSASPAAEPSAGPTPVPTPRPTATPAPVSTAPRIVSFTVPATADCAGAGGGVVDIKITWRIANATGVVIGIDSPGAYAAFKGTAGSASVPFACSESHHAYFLTTTGGTGPAAVTHRTVKRYP